MSSPSTRGEGGTASSATRKAKKKSVRMSVDMGEARADPAEVQILLPDEGVRDTGSSKGEGAVGFRNGGAGGGGGLDDVRGGLECQVMHVESKAGRGYCHVAGRDFTTAFWELRQYYVFLGSVWLGPSFL